MPIHPLPVLSDEEEEKALNRLKPPESMVVRYGRMKQIGEFRYNGQEIPGCGTRLVIRTPRGTEIAEMLTTTCTNSGCGSSITRKQMLDYFDRSGGKQYPFNTEGKVVRVATPEDVREQAHIDADKPKYTKACKQYIRELDLEMKLVDVEALLGGERIIYYFMSEDRVDFRELVKKLAGDFHTRIEMRQVGARDEARLVADFEKCGQRCCCKQFLKVLKPVSMKNAKIQKATLDPTKISGRCGRLMCCLRYEEATYDDLRKRLPNRNARVLTEDGLGTVINTQILTQLVLIELDENRQRAAYPVENIEKVDKEREQQVVAEREAARERAAEAAAAERRERRRRPAPPKNNGGQTKPRGEQAGDDQTDADGAPRKRRRRRRRRKPTGEGQANAQPQTPGAPAQGEAGEPRRPQPGRPLDDHEVQNREGDNAAAIDPPDQANASGGDQPQGKRKRRRRRRRRGGGGPSSDGPPNPGPTDE